MKDNSEKTLQSPDKIADHLRVTFVPAYLLATTIALLLAAFIVWGVLGTVSDKVYYSGVVFPVQGTTDVTLPNNGMVHIEATLPPHPHLMPGMTAFVTIKPGT